MEGLVTPPTWGNVVRGSWLQLGERANPQEPHEPTRSPTGPTAFLGAAAGGPACLPMGSRHSQREPCPPHLWDLRFGEEGTIQWYHRPLTPR